MATPNQTNVHAALAIQLSNRRVLSEEEKIFQEALKSVQDEKRKHGKLPAIFDNIRHAQNIEDVRFVLDLERKANRFWSKDVGRSWLQHLGTFAEYLWHYKVVLDAVVTRSEAERASNLDGALLTAGSRCQPGCSYLGHDGIYSECKYLMEHITRAQLTI